MMGLSHDYLDGQFLIAMPRLADKRFARTLVFMCIHDERGAMGLVVNRPLETLSYAELLEQLGLEAAPTRRHLEIADRRVHFGGPLETSRDFVLHSTDHMEEGSLLIDDQVALTSTTDILRAISMGDGPRHSLLALGYAGWGPGQLETEMQANSWLTAPGDTGLLFDHDLDTKWHRAIALLGVDINMLSMDVGHA